MNAGKTPHIGVSSVGIIFTLLKLGLEKSPYNVGFSAFPDCFVSFIAFTYSQDRHAFGIFLKDWKIFSTLNPARVIGDLLSLGAAIS
jgi:hypothetical protein